MPRGACSLKPVLPLNYLTLINSLLTFHHSLTKSLAIITNTHTQLNVNGPYSTFHNITQAHTNQLHMVPLGCTLSSYLNTQLTNMATRTSNQIRKHTINLKKAVTHTCATRFCQLDILLHQVLQLICWFDMHGDRIFCHSPWICSSKLHPNSTWQEITRARMPLKIWSFYPWIKICFIWYQMRATNKENSFQEYQYHHMNCKCMNVMYQKIRNMYC